MEKTHPLACREAGNTEQTFYRWHKEYCGMKTDQAKRLKELGQENSKLKRLVGELSLDKQILQDIARGKILSPDRRSCDVEHTQELGASERHACRLVYQPRGTQSFRNSIKGRRTRMPSSKKSNPSHQR
jgi:hypothetical protein